MPYYAEDVLLFDVVDPLQYTGAKEVRQRMEGWFSTFSGNIGYEVSGLKISAGEDIAVCHRLNHVSAETLSGGKLDMWWRDTVCFNKINGRWLITHKHSSVPFNTDTGKASTGLKP
jgi:ketosteroid isomerase-like protein